MTPEMSGVYNAAGDVRGPLRGTDVEFLNSEWCDRFRPTDLGAALRSEVACDGYEIGRASCRERV